MSEATTRAYAGDAITVTFDSELCIHSGKCVNGLPNVFDVNARPWVDVDGGTADQIAQQIDQCPSAALKYTRS